jgi:hypothetical protein
VNESLPEEPRTNFITKLIFLLSYCIDLLSVSALVKTLD